MAAAPVVATDFSQFSRLRAGAKAEDPESLRATAKQFEALFTQQLLKSMRAASPGDDVFGGEQSEFYRDLYDQQLAVHLSAGKGLGIADLMLKQMQKPQGSPPVSVEAQSSLPSQSGSTPASAASSASATPAFSQKALSLEGSRISTPAAKAPVAPRFGVATAAYVDDDAPLIATAIPSHGIVTAAYVEAAESESLPRPIPIGATTAAAAAPIASGRRQQFVEQLRPHAERAASELGISSQTLIAQAALETGWGRHVIRHSDGSSSLNFFGIKADKTWNGGRAQSATTEYVNGQKTTEAAQFRAYGSIAEAFADYVHFIKANPRYRSALAHEGSDMRYMQGLQKAGYATDPQYAAKIHRVSASNLIRNADAPRLLSL